MNQMPLKDIFEFKYLKMALDHQLKFFMIDFIMILMNFNIS